MIILINQQTNKNMAICIPKSITEKKYYPNRIEESKSDCSDYEIKNKSDI